MFTKTKTRKIKIPKNNNNYNNINNHININLMNGRLKKTKNNINYRFLEEINSNVLHSSEIKLTTHNCMIKNVINNDYTENFQQNKLINPIKSRNKFRNKEIQYLFMEELFIKFKLTTLDNWLKISREKLKLNSGKSLLQIYNNDLRNLLTTLYPNFPWNFESIKIIKPNDFSSIDKQREFMDQLYQKLQLKALEDWIKIPRKEIRNKGGENLLYGRYKKIYLTGLLQTIYPNYPWDFTKLKIKSRGKFQSIEQQQIFMDKLFIKYNLNSLDDWKNITRKIIVQNGGKSLMYYYKEDKTALVKTIYPNFPWNFPLIKFKSYFNLIENQQKYMENLFQSLNLKNMDEWLDVTRNNFKLNGAHSLLKRYNNNIKKLLSSLYPNYPWQFPFNKLFNYNNLLPTLKEWIVKYNITQKSDWYRLPSEINRKFDIVDTLKLFYPSEKWKKSNFILRTKRISQRLLFAFAQKIYPSLLIFENYFHPKLISKVDANMELDLFIPALQLAMEYQGIQHYDDMPAAFGAFESFQTRDETKEKLAEDHSIKMIYIPYWWDQSLSSLQSSLQSSVQS